MDASYSNTAQIAHNLANEVDYFINSVFADVHGLPISKKKQLSCKKDLLPYLHHILINHPQISGLAIYDKAHNIVCSTIPHNQSFLLKDSNNANAITGPLKLPMMDYPVFSIKRNMGHYSLEVFLVSPVLESIIHPLSDIRFVLLYDQNKNLLQVEHKKEEGWIYSKVMQAQLPLTENPVYASAKLHSINGVSITVIMNHQTLFYYLWHNQILLGIDLLIISCFLYFLLRNLFHKHYSLHWAIKKAIKYRQFYPVYQPLFNAITNRFTGVEVLLRWQENEDEVIMPDFFIEEAENSGLIVPISLQIIETAFKETKNILHANREFHISFNINDLHFTHVDFFDRFNALIDHYSISPQQILLEITERDLLDANNEVYIKRMEILRKMGISLAVDDYGTGHASISYLQYFPFNYLKIDKLFIHAIGTHAITESLNDAIIDLAKKINLIIIAEGVETKEQVNYLRENGVELMQGWFFSEALSVEQLKKLLQGEKK